MIWDLQCSPVYSRGCNKGPTPSTSQDPIKLLPRYNPNQKPISNPEIVIGVTSKFTDILILLARTTFVDTFPPFFTPCDFGTDPDFFFKSLHFELRNQPVPPKFLSPLFCPNNINHDHVRHHRLPSVSLRLQRNNQLKCPEGRKKPRFGWEEQWSCILPC